MSANIWQCGDCGGLHQSLPHGLCPDRDRLVTAGSSKLASYLTQENSVLHERVRKMEIALAKEREACAKVAEEYGIARDNHEKQPNTLKETALGTAKHIATLIRGRGET